MTPTLFITIYTIVSLTALAVSAYMEHLCLKMIKNNEMKNFVFVDSTVEKKYQLCKKASNACVVVFALMLLMAGFYLLGAWSVIAVAIPVGWMIFLIKDSHKSN